MFQLIGQLKVCQHIVAAIFQIREKAKNKTMVITFAILAGMIREIMTMLLN